MVKLHFLFACIFLFASQKTFSQFETNNATVTGYYVKLKLETTSDWTEIKFDALSDSFLLVHDDILGNPAYSYNHYNDYSTNYFNIIRGDTQYTAVEYTLFYPVLPGGGISITNTKGAFGMTTLTLTLQCSGNDTSMVLSNIISIDSLNTNTLTFPSSFLQCADTDTLFLPAPPSCPRILAFYYPWYGNPSGPTGAWVHWNPSLPDFGSPDTPSLGYYDSYDYTIIHQHIQWAQQYGLEGFVCSWWGTSDLTNGAIQRLFNVADTMNFSLSIYYEPSNIPSLPSAQKISRCITDITYLVNSYGNRPSTLRYNGEPVIFIYGQTMGALNLAEWQQVLSGISSLDCKLIVEKGGPGVMQMFDGVHTYNPVFKSYPRLKGINLFDGAHANLEGKIYAATASPGFVTVPRDNGLIFYSQLGASLAYKPHYLLITSFNEWHEASEIEPSLEYGYDYLNYTSAFRNYLDSICSIVGVEENLNAKNEAVCIFPNPSRSIFKIISPDKISFIQIMNLMGEKIYSCSVNSDNYEIDLSNQPQSVYFVLLKTKKGIETRKLILCD